MYSVCGVHYHDIGTDRLPEGYRHKNPKRVIAMSSFMTTYRYDQSYEKAIELENNVSAACVSAVVVEQPVAAS